MANRSVAFDGKSFTNPGVYSAIKSSMTYSKSNTGSKIIGLIGESTGGEPDKVHFFSTPAEAKKVLKSGELLKACQKAWNPVSKTKEGLELGGADIIACIRSNRATQAKKPMYATVAEATVGDVIESVSDDTTGSVAITGNYTGSKIATYVIEVTDGGAITGDTVGIKYSYGTTAEKSPIGANITTKTTQIPDSGLTISFTEGNYVIGDCFYVSVTPAVDANTATHAYVSKDYGKDNNKIQVKVEDGTLTGTKKVTVFDVKSDTYEVYDNLGFAFSIVYTGDKAYSSLSIMTDGNGKAIRLQTRIGASKESSYVDIDVELDKTSFKTIRALVRHLESYAGYKVTYNNYCNSFCNINDLDRVNSVNIKAQSYTVTQLMADIQTRLSNDSSFVNVEVYSKEVAVITNHSFVALTGGTEGKSPSSWADYFEMFGKYDIYYIVPLTSDDYIMSECLEHVKEMSDSFGKERRCIFGSDNGKSVTEISSIAHAIASERAQIVYPGIYDLNDEGEVELYPAYILAAQFAGRCAYLPDAEAATHDVFRMYGIERELDPTYEIPTLLAAGVVPFEFKISSSAFDESYVWCVQDITTTLEDDPLMRERPVGVTADNINKQIRDEIDNLSVGRKTVIGTLTTLRNIVERILENKKSKEEVINDYKDVSVRSESDVIYIEYSAAPAQPNNFTFVTGHFYSKDLFLDGNDTE